MSAAIQHGLDEWLSYNERSTRPVPTDWIPVAGRFLHWCPFVQSLVDEYSDDIDRCRCYYTRAFLDAQDRRAVEIDARRVPRE